MFFYFKVPVLCSVLVFCSKPSSYINNNKCPEHVPGRMGTQEREEAINCRLIAGSTFFLFVLFCQYIFLFHIDPGWSTKQMTALLGEIYLNYNMTFSFH